ncbi:marvel domain-containing protein [Lasiosphaeris hirsuta]|uniref:Marvel domain-containing protein n=1 Tax=Lasiosphaeris hirsuta TaxID=260670 RepID=A0AA40AFB5_9PEZI|nr:marvel domain-containing protein [Lasiosphaeris hirsuta]
MLAGVAIGFRALQLIFSVVILGLAVTLIKAQVYDSAPTTTKYSSFTGGFGILVAGAGVAGLFFDAIPDIVNLALDTLAGLLFAAGGIAWAIGIKGITCTSDYDVEKMLYNGLLNLGTISSGGQTGYGVGAISSTDDEVVSHLKSNCQKGFADEIISFLSFGVAAGLVGLGYLRMRKGGSSSGAGRYVA